MKTKAALDKGFITTNCSIKPTNVLNTRPAALSAFRERYTVP